MVIVQNPPIIIKNHLKFKSYYSIESCCVAVVYCIYDKKKKTIIQIGTSRPCGNNYNKPSIHAEEICINYCRKNDKRNKYKIFIWRYSKEGKIKPVYCCTACCLLAKKYNYSDKIFTFENEKVCVAVGKPYTTIGYLIKNGL
jgi:hypothetical protein